MKFRNTVTILHLGDLHLDSPFSMLDRVEAQKENAAILKVFKTAMRYTHEHDIDIVLISGDLFDGDKCSTETAQELCKEIKALPECRFVISPGNHDPYSAESAYSKIDFPENCHVFRSPSISSVYYSELNTEVYGYAFTEKELRTDPLSGFKVNDTSRVNLLVCHGNVKETGHADGIPDISAASLSAGGIDYSALGHIHTCEKLFHASDSLGFTATTDANVDTLYAYSGCIAGRDYGEQGRKGGIVVTIQKDGIEKARIEAKRVVFCPWVYRAVSVDVSAAHDICEIARRAINNIPPEPPRMKRHLRLELCGKLSPKITETESVLSLCELVELQIRAQLTERAESNEKAQPSTDIKLNSIISLTVTDQTVGEKIKPAKRDDNKSLKTDSRGKSSVKDLFIQLLSIDLGSDDPKTRERAELALKLGLEALE